MKILFLGDIMGIPGCAAVRDYLPQLIQNLKPDFTIANAENAAYHGMSRAIVADLFAAGVDGLTSGNHMWDHDDIYALLAEDSRILRPDNYTADKPGRGFMTLEKNGLSLLVVNMLGKTFMTDDVKNPFHETARIIADAPLGRANHAILVDFHAETTAEKQCIGTYLDGRVSAVLGTHTHVPTADYRVLPGGTAFQTDVGMCGAYDSVIGCDKHAFTAMMSGESNSKEKFPQPSGIPTLCGAIIETDDQTGLARSIRPVRHGGILDPA